MNKLKFIPNWRRAWRMFSMQVSALGLSSVGAWGMLPQEWKEQIPVGYVQWAAGISFLLIMAGRMIDQPTVQPKDEVPNDSGPT